MLNSTLIKWLSRDVPDKSSGQSVRKNVSLFTDIGLIRSQNQDRVACLHIDSATPSESSFMAIAVSDGMGGMKDGAECATRTIASFFSALTKHRHRPELERLRISTIEANESVYRFSNGAGGATLSALLITDKFGTFSVNVGDSRIYAETLTEPKELHRITRDDSLAEAVGGHGRELLQFIGMGPGIQPHINFVDSVYDRFLLTTDGIHFVDNDTLSLIFINSANINQAANRLSTLARWLGAHDNASGAVISLQDAHKSLSKTNERSLKILDPFSELYISSVMDEQKREQRTRESLLSTPALTPVETEPLNDAAADKDTKKPTTRIKRSRAKTKDPKHTSESESKPQELQIVIEMDTEHKDGADDLVK